MWAWAWVTTAFGGDCAETTTATDLVAAVEAAEAAWSQADSDGFLAGLDRADGVLPCVRDPVARPLAAQLHRAQGLRAFVRQDLHDATSAFSAARALQPAYAFPDNVLPPNHPANKLYKGSAGEDLATVDVATPAEGYLHFDGRQGTRRFTGAPTLFQRFDAAGSVVDTAYLWPADPLPDYAVAAEAAPTPSPAQEPSSEGPNLVVLGTAAAVGVTAGVLYGLAGASHGRFNDPATPYADGEQLQSRTNTLVVASGAAAGVAVGLGVVSVVLP